MINRILIRIKVVQILYSYLLSRSEFKIDAAPTGASRDRRFAYAAYMDMLMLIEELSGCRVNNPERDLRIPEIDKGLRTNRVGRALADNVELKELTYKDLYDLNRLKDVLPMLYHRIVDSAMYKDYARKRSRSLDDDVRFWTVVLETIVLKDKDVIAALRTNEEFSLAGLNHGVRAAIDTLNSFNDSRMAYLKARKDLKDSLDQAYKLYLSLFVLIVQLTDEQIDRIEVAKGKYLVKAEDLNPNMRLAENRLASFLRENPTITKFVDDNKFSWLVSQGLIKNLLDLILQSDLYREYVATPSTDWHTDCEFWRSVIRNIVLPSDYLDEALESMSVYWNDDLATVGTFVLKTLRRFAASDESDCVDAFLPQFKDNEDAEFGEKLFTFAVENREEYRGYIDHFISADWDPDRLAFMDIVIMITTLAEIINFPAIPIPVSLNEYIEIANNYSTRRSGPFINGMLFSIIKMLSDTGKINKPFLAGPLNDDK